MKKLVFAFFLIAIIVISNTGAASAAVQDYTSSYSSTNMYVSQRLTYTLSGLDAGTEYTWSLQMMRIDFPSAVDFTAQTLSCTGSTSCSLHFNLYEILPTTAFGPARVLDNFGQVIGEHFFSPGVDIAPWATDQQNPADEKTVISNGARPLFTAALGVNHFELLGGEVGNRIITTVGSYTLLHYRTSLADYQDERIEINVASAASDTQARFDVEEFVEYNRHSSNPSISSQNIHSFVVLNTDGVRPIFVNQLQDAAFSGNFDNPHTLTMSPGMFNYARLTGAGAVKSYGESVWMVTTVIPDWAGTARNQVGVGRNQFATLIAVEQAVYDAYPDITLLDCEAGDPIASCDIEDTTDHPFATSQDVTFIVAAVAVEGQTILWQRNASSWQYSQPLALTNLYFEGGGYEITAAVGFDERLRTIVAESGVSRDTMFLLFFIVANLLTFIGMASVGMGHPTLYGLVFLIYGVMFMFASFFDSWIAIIMGLLFVLVLLGMFRSRAVAS